MPAKKPRSSNRRTPKRGTFKKFSVGPDTANKDLYLTIEGFKAVGKSTTLRVAPLTIISGTNSAGKSSFIQPLLIMKQTLESSFDPGALLLFGPNAKFTDISQTFSRGKSKNSRASGFTVTLKCGDHIRSIKYIETSNGYSIGEDVAKSKDGQVVISGEVDELPLEEYEKSFNSYGQMMLEQINGGKLFSLEPGKKSKMRLPTKRQRCFLDAQLVVDGPHGESINLGSNFVDSHTDAWTKIIRGIIHVPGLRGNPEREYSRSAVGNTYPGTFETYVASIILEWSQKDPRRLEMLSSELSELGLTWKVRARRVNDAAVELLVGRMPHAQQGGALDMVSVADVGFGVSQTLPVIVALLVASPGQIVYLEQPEIHLHPRAQVQLAKALVRATQRGVKVIAETHSSLLIRAIQTEVALRTISDKDVSMNWFSRDENTGFSNIAVADLDEMGRFGDWPLDFDEISQDADMAYIDAISQR